MNKILYNYSTTYLMTRLWRKYVSKHRGRIIIAFICMIILSGITALQIQLIKPMVNDVLGGTEMYVVYLVAGTFFVIGIIKAVALYIQNIFMQRTSLLVVNELKLEMYKSLLNFDTKYLEGEGTARHLSKFSVDIGNISALLTVFLVGIIRDTFMTIFLFGVMFYNSYEMTLLSFIFLPLMLYSVLKIGKKIENIYIDLFEESGKMISIIDDTLKGAREIKAYNLFNFAYSSVGKTLQKTFSLNYRGQRTASLTSPILEIMTAIAIAGMMFWGGFLVQGGKLNTGEFMAFFIAMTTAYRPIKSLSNLNIVLRSGTASCKRFFSVIDREPEIKDTPKSKSIEMVKGSIDFDDVSFNYNPDKEVLSGINIKICAGESVAFVGESGGGKSTILNLIPRFYDIEKGSLKIDGKNIKDITLESLRDNIALVSQETVLFNVSIRDNVELGKLGSSDEEIIDALKKASAWQFVKNTTDGLDSMVGERGLQLSGGQRQRIAIARAFLKNAPILLLDEATSSLDTKSEEVIQKSLNALKKGRTTITIAHRLSTIQDSDIIYVIENGEVVESGTHKSLNAKGGVYASLSNAQSL